MKSRHFLDENVENEHRQLVKERDEINGSVASRYSSASIVTKNLYKEQKKSRICR